MNIICQVKSNIKNLVFSKSGCKENSNWEEHPHRFQNLMKAVSKSGIKESLGTLYIHKCGITKIEGEEVMKSLGMENVIVHGSSL